MQNLCQTQPVQKGNASSLRQLINHVSSHMNALQALSMNVPIQDLLLNHLILATLDTNSTRMGADYGVAHRHPNCRISHILGIKVQSLGVTSDYPLTEVTCYHSTFVSQLEKRSVNLHTRM